MKKMPKNNMTKIFTKILCCIMIAVIGVTVFTNTQIEHKDTITSNMDLVADANVAKDTNDVIYLSDINYLSGKSGWQSLLMDKVNGGGKISVKVENSAYTFDKGIWAHASSELIYDISAYSNVYKYFTAYLGINTTSNKGNGVKFYIYTSNDNKTWNLKTEENPEVTNPGANAKLVQIDITGAKYLKLVANDNGANGNDHSVYADAKLVKDIKTQNVVKSVEEYDEIIKTKYANATLDNKEYELILLQRDFVSKAGQFALKTFVNESKNNKETLDWLMNNLDILRYYILGGTPDGGNYYNSLTQLARLYYNYKEDFSNTEKLNNKWDSSLTYGELYKKMAITLSLTHSQRVGLWMQGGAVENQSDAVKRYAIYKYLHKNGKLNANIPNWDMTLWFESLRVEEMRFIMNNAIDDEEILWLNDYVQSFLDQYKQGKYLTPHPYMAYVWPNYGNNIYYDEANKDYFNELFAVNKNNGNSGKELTDENGKNIGKIGLFDVSYTIPGGKENPEYTIKITRGTSNYKLYKLWMNFRNKFGTGAVCGGISKSGSNIRATHGIPATVIGQPGHAALLYYTKNSDGKGYWGIDNDVSGWTLSEKGERLLLGWGNANTTYARGSYQVVYMQLAQEAINDFDNLVKAEEMVKLAEVYAGELKKQEEIYRKALNIQSINLDAWLGLINVYNQSTTKTENDYFNLAEELAENLKYYPLPMYHLTNLIKPKLTSVENVYKFSLLQTRILTEGSKVANTDTNVLQPSLTRVEANFLLGKLDNSIATFSFDGDDAGKIVLSSRFDGSGIRWDYSLDGKKTWKEVSFTGDEPHKLQLTKQEINSINAENDIYVHIVGVNYEEKNLFKIDITEQELPTTIFANDLENRVVGATLIMEWRMSEKDDWTSYEKSSPDLTGNKTVEVRVKANGTKLTSPSQIYTFTEDNQPDTRKYIPVSHLSIHSVSTEATSQGGAAINAIDANYNTRWHSAWNGSDTNRFITIKLDKPVYLSAVEFVPAGGGNGRINDGTIYGSTDGENWIELTNRKGITYKTQANTIEQAIEYTQKFEIAEDKRIEVQYVKIVADKTNGNWFTARAFNLYQDLTKNPHPTAGIAYSTTESTSGDVIVRLVNASTKIKITNNNGSDTYTFTKNGEFTFEFEDEKGNKGTATAKVNWIDKDIPTADVDYELDSNKKLVILLGNISENVYLLDKNNQKLNYIEVKDKKIITVSYINSSNQIYKIVEVDEKGNTTKITYKNTTGKVENVDTFVTTIENGKVTGELYYDKDGKSVTVSDSDKQTLERLQQVISNPLEYTFETSGNYEFRLQDNANNITTKNVRVDYIDSETEKDSIILASDITYNITGLTNKDVVATINTYIIDADKEDAKVEMVDNQSKTYTFTKNGEYTFKYKDSRDVNNLEVKTNTAKVTWIDKVAPTASINYSTKETAEKVTVTLVNESEKITIINNGGNRTYTFTKNGEFTFEYVDAAGNKGKTTAKVDWIGTPAAKTTIDYSTTKKTNKSVIATLTSSDKITVTNNNGKTEYTFTKNGEFTFEYTDSKGNKGTQTAKVDWIDTETPTVTIKYSTTNKTNKPVTVTITTSSEPIMITNNNGKTTYTFTENGTFTFEFKDEAGNKGKITAKVDWIEKTTTEKPGTNTEEKPSNKPSEGTNDNISSKPTTTPNTDDKANNDKNQTPDNTINSDKENNSTITKPDDNKNNDNINDTIVDNSTKEKSSWSNVIFYIIPIIVVIIISFLLTVLYKNKKNQ